MDQPTGSSEAPERAVSSEPSSTRPNPFTEGDDSSRKRRRTSMSGGSRSRSVESTRSGTSSSSATGHRVDDPNTQDSAMKIDTGPSTPQTPELQSTAREPPTEPPSSRVTINLRNAAQPAPSSSSPVSPTPRTLPARPTEPSDGIKKSVEDLEEVDMVQAPIEITDTPPSTSSSMQSPEVEVVAVPDDSQDAPFDDEVSIIREDAASFDPTAEFPYRDQHESLTDTVTKLVNYVSPSQAPPEEAVLETLRSWMISYIRYVGSVGSKAAYESHIAYHNFWHMFPEIAWMLSNRKPSVSRDSRHITTDFFLVYAKLASYIVEFDSLTAQAFQAAVGVERRQPEFLLGRYVPPLLFFARREDSRSHNGQLPDEELLWTRAADVTEMMQVFQSGAGNIKGLNKLTQMHLSNAPRYQHLMDVLLPISNITALNLQKTMLGIRGQTSLQNIEVAKVRLADGHLLYNMISGALSMSIEKNVTQLSNETTQGLITSLSEILRLVLNGDHKLATERLKAHRQTHPELPLRFTPEAVSLEWRLGVFGKLITSSQMQLRVMAASTMCHDLVTCWKKYSDNEDESAKFLTYIAEYLLGTQLVDYILGPTCHPEITIESGNIVGFLVVTHFYRDEQTDMLWQTITTTQDPRVSEALIRMTTSIVNLFYKEELLYLCEKLYNLPIDNFTPSVRGLCDSILRNLHTKFQLVGEAPSTLPLRLCIRLLRESSVSVYTSESHIAHPEVHQFAMIKFQELVKDGLDPDTRREFYLDCVRDIVAKSSTTLGSLWCLFVALRPVELELEVLTTKHNLTALLVDELEHAILAEQSKGVKSPMVLCEPVNSPRRDFISLILAHQADTITPDLGPRLWDMLVGHGAACQRDRGAGWAILNTVPRKDGKKSVLDNPFLAVCFHDYLPSLPRDCLCEGALQFVKSVVLPRVNDINEIILDDDQSLAQSGVEQLWRMILDVDDMALVGAAIQTLVDDIYIDSKSIMSYPHHRACQVHLRLVNRCLKQMEGAAKRLEAFGEGTRGGEDEPMVIVATEDQTQEQERIFTRSLAVLRHFLKAHQAKAHFSAPDLRALTPGSPGVAEGESAELKFQSFDGNKQTDIMPLEVGRRNTAASLLASIRKVTGFENYRIYYRGHPFAPNESQICKSLEDLKIHDGLILVKREENGTAAASRIKPGASLLEIEILGHFEQLWNYLSMAEVLAREIHSFLIKLPADAHMLAAFDSPDTSYQQIFPPGQPFKSLYALHAMKEYIDSAARRLRDATSTITESQDVAVEGYLDSLVRVRKLVVAAISDPKIIDSCDSETLKSRVIFNLMNVYLLTFREPEVLGSVIRPKAVAIAPADRLVDILTSAVALQRSDTSNSLIASTFLGILRSASVDLAFWNSLKTLPNLESLLGTLLLDEPSDTIRTNIAKLIEERVISSDGSTENIRSFCEFLWPVVSRLIPRAAQSPRQCQQVFQLSQVLVGELVLEENQSVVSLSELARQCGDLLLKHESTEQLGHFNSEDAVASGLAKLLFSCLCCDQTDADVGNDLPAHLASKLFWKHLFPPPRQQDGEPGQSCILSTETRNVFTDTIFYLVELSERELFSLLEDLDNLVPFDEFDHDPYLYELQPQFDRMSAVRAPCGYVGLRNLSNTCYLNSLFTQLFMNTGFRQFMMNARVPDQQNSHGLLRETRKLFAFMQNSSRKFIDPSLLVGSIKTYEDMVIDVHNQMDVDEFYNLLFDRWEGQLSTTEERKALRSFYGGQLVQQVASKECEHISERLEPFSAIQCDIKGKSTLQDSLQAYVDGEIMDGDNKYKCSNCDRHVDAVKRACLKDIPDNLIFHLKRFDFNLRTLMRSKINDYFSFPTKIDMRPYTIDHLGSPSPPGEEDIFELVGVLVHAGTAESGHYYSYIRERPTTGSSESWYEFNDDMVSPWNPADLEKSTFGGPDGPFENGVSYDKTYSAYMLFYQRSSVLKAEQDKLQSLCLSTPLKVDVPAAVAEHIMGENTILLRRHCLYDPGHAKFVLKMFQHAVLRAGHSPVGHTLQKRAMHMVLGHLDQVISRTKDLPDFEEFRDAIEHACNSCGRCAMDFFEYFQERHESFRHLLQRNPDASVRYATGSMFIAALRKIKEWNPEVWSLYHADFDEPIMMQIVQLFDTLFINFHANIRSWAEVFQTILAFAKMGTLETALLLSEDWLVKVLRIIFADANMQMPSNYTRMLSNVIRRLNNTRIVQYEMVIQLVDHFMDTLEDTIDPSSIVDNAEMRLEIFMETHALRLSWTPEEVNILAHEWVKGAGSTFIKKLIDINQDHPHTASIIKRVIYLNPDMEHRVFFAIKNMISGQMVPQAVAPYIMAAVTFSEQSRDAGLIHNLFRHIALQCRSLQNSEGGAFLEFFKLAFASLQTDHEEDRAARYAMYIEHIPFWGPSLLGYYHADVRRDTEDFLSLWLSTHAPDGNQDAELALTVNMAARKLAMNCLHHLRDNFVQRRAQVAKQSTESLQNIIAACEMFFQVDVAVDGERVVSYAEFQEHLRSIIEPLRRMTVEELEDEGSGMSPGLYSDSDTIASEPEG